MTLSAKNLSDNDIQQSVADHLAWDSRLDESNIRVTAQDGIITLTGSVSTYPQRQAARFDALACPGVQQVENLLTVDHPTAHPRPDDTEITSNIVTLLRWRPQLDITDIGIYVNNGNVRLTGTVNAYWKKLRVEELTSTVTGVREIVNELAVVPTEQVLDQALADTITARYEKDPFMDNQTIDIIVNNGVVTLNGTVSSVDEYLRARDIVNELEGVTQVNNKLVIR